MQATTEWKRGHIWDILATVQPWDRGLSPPPCFRVLFGKVQQCSILRNQTTGNLKSHHLQAGVTALSVPPPPPFLSAVHEKVLLFFFVIFKGTFGLFGGGGEHVPLRPPLGPALPWSGVRKGQTELHRQTVSLVKFHSILHK